MDPSATTRGGGGGAGAEGAAGAGARRRRVTCNSRCKHDCSRSVPGGASAAPESPTGTASGDEGEARG